MKILTIGNFTTGWDGSICDEEHIAKALENFGHEVTRWQREKVVYDDRPDASYLHCDFILVAQWDGFPAEKLDQIKMFYDCPVVYWAFDHQDQGQLWHQRLIDSADLYLSKRIADSKYSNWQWLSQDFAPDFLDKYRGDVEKDIDVLFTGSYLDFAKERIETLKAVDEKYDLQIYSFTPDQWKAAGFKNVHGPMMDNELPYLYARARVNLSIDHTIEAGYWSDRNAQIMACGGLVLFRYVPLSRSIFRGNIAYFHNTEDCLNQIGFYLENPKIAEAVASWGYEYAQANMMAEDRVIDLLTIVESIL